MSKLQSKRISNNDDDVSSDVVDFNKSSDRPIQSAVDNSKKLKSSSKKARVKVLSNPSDIMENSDENQDKKKFQNNLNPFASLATAAPHKRVQSNDMGNYSQRSMASVES